MAQKVMIELIDDMDGTPATETVKFGLDGKSYEIDLSETNAANLRELIGEFTRHARIDAGAKASKGSKASKVSNDGPSPKEIRAWATANGIEVNDRGRVSAEIRAQYDAAHA